MGKTKKVFKFFYIFDLEKEENWLREMAQKGWFFQKVNLFGIYTFIKGPSKDKVYKIDFNNKIEDVEEYYDLFKESGWSFIHKIREFRYFKYSGQSNSFDNLKIYNDYSQQLKWLHKWLIVCLSAYGIEFVALYQILFLQGSTNIGINVGVIIILLFILMISIILFRFVNSYIVLKRKVKDTESTDYYGKGASKKFTSLVSLIITPIVVSVALALTVTVLATVGDSEKAIKNRILQLEKGSSYPINTIDYLISEDIGDFKVSLYGNNNRIGVIALEKVVFNRYKVVTNFNSGFDPNHKALTDHINIANSRYRVIYGNDENQEIDNALIKYKNGALGKVTNDEIVRKDKNFIMLIKGDKEIEDIKIFDKNNTDISNKYIKLKSKSS